MNHLTTQQLEDLGFKIVKSGHGDRFIWQRRKHKEQDIWIETTWEKSGVFYLQEIKCAFVNLEILKTILK